MVLQPEAARRSFVHIRARDGGPGYLVVADLFRQGLGPHDHTFYLQTEPGNSISIGNAATGRDARATFVAPTGARLGVTMRAAHPGPPARTRSPPTIRTSARTRARIGGRANAFEMLSMLDPEGPDNPAPHATGVDATDAVRAP